jgi:hypothetical protein
MKRRDAGAAPSRSASPKDALFKYLILLMILLHGRVRNVWTNRHCVHDETAMAR